MKTFIAAILALTFVFSVAEVYALDLGEQITIYDNNSQSNNKWWDGRNGTGTAKEDQEVEPGMQSGQGWDLEGFFIDNWTLSMVGGFDFINGYKNRTSGDIFLDVDGDVKFGKDAPSTGLKRNGNKDVKNIFGYDYVLDLDFGNNSYDIYKIDENTDVTMGYYRQNDSTTAWAYNEESESGELIGSGSITYQGEFSDAEVGFKGDSKSNKKSHHVASFDLSFLGALYPESTTFTSHFTMSCGNDNLMGQGITPETPAATPEPGTLLLFGAGIAGLAAIIRKRRQ